MKKNYFLNMSFQKIYFVKENKQQHDHWWYVYAK